MEEYNAYKYRTQTVLRDGGISVGNVTWKKSTHDVIFQTKQVLVDRIVTSPSTIIGFV